MTASKFVKLPADWHAETLANGQTIAPGEPFERSLLDKTADERVAGLVIDSVAPAEVKS